MELQCWKEEVDAYSIWCVSHNSMSSSTHYPIIIESITIIASERSERADLVVSRARFFAIYKSPRLRSSGVWWLCVSHRRCRCKSVVSSLPVNSRNPGGVESAIDNRPPSNIGRACVTTKEAKRKIITASER